MFKPNHSFIPDHEKLRFVLDTETLSMDPKAAVIDIGLVEILGNDRFFHAQIKPSCYDGSLDFLVNAGTKEFHASKNPGYLEMLERNGMHFATAVGRLYDFLVDLQSMENKQIVIYCQGTDFDIPIMKHLFEVCQTPLPWHYRNVRDLRTLQNLTPGLKYVAGNHTALEDARYSAEHLLKQASVSTELHNYLFGNFQ